MKENAYSLTPKMWSSAVDEMPRERSLKYIAEGEPDHIKARDGRIIGIRKRGPNYGVPVIRFHGTPGSSKAPLTPEEDLETIGINMISFDRAGYGGSDRHKGLSIKDTALDVIDILHTLNITDKVTLLAYSGGVSHALATAAQTELRDRISGLVVLSGKAPWEIGTSLESKVTKDNREIYAAARENPKALRSKITRRARRIQQDRFSLMKNLYPIISENDLLYFMSEGLSWAIAEGHADGLSQNGNGLYDDYMALQKQSGFALSDIVAPTVIWHGANDPFASYEEAQWLQEQIPHAEIMIDELTSHFGSLGVTSPALRWLRDKYIGPERAQQLQNLKAAWITKWNKDFNENWTNFSIARGEYAIDDYITRDAIRGHTNRTINIDALAEGHASKEVLEL